MKKKCINELVLVLVLGNFISFLYVAHRGMDHFTRESIVFLVILEVLAMLISYLVQFFLWTGEDKTEYVLEKNNRSYLLTWLCIVVVYVYCSINGKYARLNTIILLVVYLFFRIIFYRKNERDFYGNEKMVSKYSQTITFLLFSYGMLINIFVWKFSIVSTYFLLFCITSIISCAIIMGIHMHLSKGRWYSIEFIAYVFELVLGIYGVYMAKKAMCNWMCILIFIVVLFIFLIGSSNCEKN